jgi:hypothetical protein
MHFEPRINNPTDVEAKAIDAILARGACPTVQFSEPPYPPGLLKRVNDLCRQFGDALEVRFYDHYEDGFDANVLIDLPDVSWLSVDCLLRIQNEATICQLKRLTKLSFGVYWFDDPSFLSRLPLEPLTKLLLSETARKNFDLRPLERCKSLYQFGVTGHRKNLECLGGLPLLTDLTLSSTPKQQKLGFLNKLKPLRSLTLLLGGRVDLQEFSHPLLEELEILRVRGFEWLGPLARFPRLRRLHIEDQIQLHSLAIDNPNIEELIVGNCKTLESISGLDQLPKLRHLRIYRTKVDLNPLLDQAWPRSMDVLALYCGSERWNAAARAKLDQRGYREWS